MASFRSLLSRRQTDRTTLTFGSCVFLFNHFPPGLFRGNLLATSPRKSKLKNRKTKTQDFLLSLGITCRFSSSVRIRNASSFRPALASPIFRSGDRYL